MQTWILRIVFFVFVATLLLYLFSVIKKINRSERVESVSQIVLDSVIVSDESIYITGKIREDNTSIWSYKDYSFTVEGNDVYFTIYSYPEYGKLIFSHLDFCITVEGSFSNTEKVYLLDNEETLTIWNR
jgi:hypothetical protein